MNTTDKIVYVAIMRGQQADLDLLVHLFTEEFCRVVRTEDPDELLHCLHSSQFVLESDYEEMLLEDGTVGYIDKNPERIREIAAKMLGSMHGAAKLIRSRYEPVEIYALQKRTPDGESIAGTAWGGGGWDKTIPLPPERKGLPKLAREWAKKGFEDETVAFALQLYGFLPVSWVSLYVIYEVIESDVGKSRELEAKKWLSRRRLRQFKFTANSTRDLRFGVRHGKNKNSRKKPPESMTLAEGEACVRHLLNCWLSEKVGMHMTGY